MIASHPETMRLCCPIVFTVIGIEQGGSFRTLDIDEADGIAYTSTDCFATDVAQVGNTQLTPLDGVFLLTYNMLIFRYIYAVYSIIGIDKTLATITVVFPFSYAELFARLNAESESITMSMFPLS